MTVIVKHKQFRAFTLVETVTALIVSGAIFVGVFSIFSILNDKFEAELVRSELMAYCNYALDDIAQSIRLADNIVCESQMIKTFVEGKIFPQQTYTYSEEEGIIKNGIPIHKEVENNSNNTEAGTSKHKLFYIPKNENGFIKYRLVMNEPSLVHLCQPLSRLEMIETYNIYTKDADPLLKSSSFLIKLRAMLIMGWDEGDPSNKVLDFKRIAFSPGKWINNP